MPSRLALTQTKRELLSQQQAATRQLRPAPHLRAGDMARVAWLMCKDAMQDVVQQESRSAVVKSRSLAGAHACE